MILTVREIRRSFVDTDSNIRVHERVFVYCLLFCYMAWEIPDPRLVQFVLINIYVFCTPVREDNPRALASG